MQVFCSCAYCGQFEEKTLVSDRTERRHLEIYGLHESKNDPMGKF